MSKGTPQTPGKESSRVSKPWGHYEILHGELGFQVKRIQVNPGCRLSLQKHAKRSERWTIVKGRGKAAVNDEEIPVEVGSALEVPLGAVHRMSNTGEAPLVFIEVMLGDYLGEDDIVRLEDDYDRCG